MLVRLPTLHAPSSSMADVDLQRSGPAATNCITRLPRRVLGDADRSWLGLGRPWGCGPSKSRMLTDPSDGCQPRVATGTTLVLERAGIPAWPPGVPAHSGGRKHRDLAPRLRPLRPTAVGRATLAADSGAANYPHVQIVAGLPGALGASLSPVR